NGSIDLNGQRATNPRPPVGQVEATDASGKLMTGSTSEGNQAGHNPNREQRLANWEKVLLAALATVLVGFGVVVEIRAAFLHQRMTDLGVFLRAAWAVRAGEDLYAVTDDKGLHYHYPPLFAILLTPFADPPAGVQVTGQVPFRVTVALWYLFSLV